MPPKLEAPGNTPVAFTLENWALLQSIPTKLSEIAILLKESIEAQKEETAALHLALEKAHLRIDEAHARISKQDRLLSKWIGTGIGAGTSIVVGYAVLKFIFNRG